MGLMRSNCAFCDEFETPGTVDSRIILQEEGLVLVPTEGCFVPGYCLLMPEEHHYSFSSLDTGTLLQAGVRLEEVRAVIAGHFGPTIVAEHGAAECARGAACCDHAHIHLIPCQPDRVASAYFKAARTLPRVFRGMRDLAVLDSPPYMMLSPAPGVYWVWDADGFPSQFVRMVCADVLGIPEFYDWRYHRFVENMQFTQRVLSTALGQADVPCAV